MQRVRAELLVLSRKAQDNGTDQQLSEHIDMFLSSLQSLLTERLINTMHPTILRQLYVRWHQLLHVHSADLEACITALAARIWVATGDREMVAPPATGNVASIFGSSKTTH